MSRAILADLDWLGLSVRRAGRVPVAAAGLYEAALDRLRGEGLLYRCWCTRAEIAASTSAPAR